MIYEITESPFDERKRGKTPKDSKLFQKKPQTAKYALSHRSDAVKGGDAEAASQGNCHNDDFAGKTGRQICCCCQQKDFWIGSEEGHVPGIQAAPGSWPQSSDVLYLGFWD